MATPSPPVLRSLVQSPPFIVFTGDAFFRSPWHSFHHKSRAYLCPVPLKLSRVSRVHCVAKPTEERDLEILDGESDDDSGGDRQDVKVEFRRRAEAEEPVREEFPSGGLQRVVSSSSESISLGIREPVYEVVEVSLNGNVSTKKINRRHLLKSSGLRPRDIRSVDPSLWLTNTMPSLLVRENAILLNLGSLRAIVMQESVFIFNYNRKGGKAFIDSLLPRLNPKSMSGCPSMPFELEVVEAALHSRIQRFERTLMDLEPRVSMET